MSKENKVYLFTKHEFLLLVAAAGMHRIYGFDMKAEELEQEGAIYVLQSLTQRSYLQAEEEKLVLTKEMGELFSHIKNAETVMDVHKSSGRNCVIYLENVAVKVSQSLRRKDTLEVMVLAAAEVWNYLREEGWIPEA